MWGNNCCSRLRNLSGNLSRWPTYRTEVHRGLHPHLIDVAQELREPDKAKRIHYCRWFRTLIEENRTDLWVMLWSVMKHGFTLAALWTATCLPVPAFCFLKFGVRCALSRKDRWQKLIPGNHNPAHSLPEEDEREPGLKKVVPHVILPTKQCRSWNIFGYRLISKGSRLPRSPDITCPDFHSWGYLKGVTLNKIPHILKEFKVSIESDISTVQLLKFQANTLKRLCACIQEQGGHFQHLLQNVQYSKHSLEPSNISLKKCNNAISVTSRLNNFV